MEILLRTGRNLGLEMKPTTVTLSAGSGGRAMVGSKSRALLEEIKHGRATANTSFQDLVALLLVLGFQRRIRGDHHILWKQGVPEIINLQPRRSKAKPYQVKQVRSILIKYNLGFGDE
jgi:HicA toxin of bacterial toxin-antitoxin,